MDDLWDVERLFLDLKIFGCKVVPCNRFGLALFKYASKHDLACVEVCLADLKAIACVSPSQKLMAFL